jgi:hypothetical protein
VDFSNLTFGREVAANGIRMSISIHYTPDGTFTLGTYRIRQ